MDVLKYLHTSVAQSFENSFDHAYKDLNAELTRRDERVKDAEQAVKVADEARRGTDSRVKGLEHEVAELKEKLHPCELDGKSREFKASMQTRYGPEHVLEKLDTSDMNDLRPEVKAQITNVGDNYRTLYGAFQELVDVCGALRAKVDNHKRKLVQWQSFIAQEEFTVKVSETPTTFKRVRAAFKPKDDSRLSEQAVMRSPTCHSTRTTGSSRGKELQGQGAHTVPSFNSELPESDPTASDPSLSSEGTASEISNRTATVHPKRKRASLPEPAPPKSSPPDDLKHDQGQQPITIKSEPVPSSPPQSLPDYQPPVSTQDLDDVGSSVETPTKRNRYRSGSRGGKCPPFTRTFEAEKEREEDHEDYQHDEPERRKPKRPRVLQPIDGNLRASIKSDQQSIAKSTKAKHAIPSIAEDGENFTDASSQRSENHASPGNAEQPSLETNQPPTRQRLQNLLEGPAPPRSLLRANPGPRPPIHNKDYNTRYPYGAVSNGSGGDCLEEFAAKPVPPSTNSGPKAPVRGQGSRSIEAPPRPRRRPYRDWPLERLEPNHFKINPDYNHGLGYAFDSVVRKKDERTCVSGCMRPGCCGDKFLAMARIGGHPTNNNGPQREVEEQRILEEYLGDEKHLLDTMSPQDREGLLHEAQARHLANVHGKHKQIHQRSRTPPGFWRTEMPDTQELEQDRKEARELERETVYERYREAKRHGGLWKFADE